jgi:hypothetical protein
MLTAIGLPALKFCAIVIQPPGECWSFSFYGGIGAIPRVEQGSTLTCKNYQVSIVANSFFEPGGMLQWVSGGIELV